MHISHFARELSNGKSEILVEKSARRASVLLELNLRTAFH